MKQQKKLSTNRTVRTQPPETISKLAMILIRSKNLNLSDKVKDAQDMLQKWSKERINLAKSLATLNYGRSWSFVANFYWIIDGIFLYNLHCQSQLVHPLLEYCPNWPYVLLMPLRPKNKFRQQSGTIRSLLTKLHSIMGHFFKWEKSFRIARLTNPDYEHTAQTQIQKPGEFKMILASTRRLFF